MALALVINCNYDNFPENKLNGCINDGDNFINALKNIEPDLTVIRMTDTLPVSSILYPSKMKIVRQLFQFVRSSQLRNYLYFSGHGSFTQDYNGDEQKISRTFSGKVIMNSQSIGKDSGFVTNDVNRLDILIDDDIYKILSFASNKKTIYCFADCCHSGTIMDLKYLNMLLLTKKFDGTDVISILNDVNQQRRYFISKSFYETAPLPAKIYLFSGCRDNQCSYEDNSTGQSQGVLTTQLCKILSYNKLNTLTFKQFYIILCGLINNPQQVPILSTSHHTNIDSEKVFPFFKISKTVTRGTANIMNALVRSKNTKFHITKDELDSEKNDLESK